MEWLKWIFRFKWSLAETVIHTNFDQVVRDGFTAREKWINTSTGEVRFLYWGINCLQWFGRYKHGLGQFDLPHPLGTLVKPPPPPAPPR